MKRLGSSDSLGGAMMSLCPNSTDGDDQANNTTLYTKEFHTILDGLDEEGCSGDEPGSGREKKRRLGVDQVKALEKNFEVENKLEPERKLKLAQELGLQPRQVAVWFQNRRARWKTKQLERDYGVLKNSYDDLKLNYEKLKRDNEALLKEVKELKSKLESDDGNSEVSLEEEAILSDAEEKPNLESAAVSNFLEEMKTEDLSEDHRTLLCGSSILVYEFNKDGSYDSDSSAILNEDHHLTNNNDSRPSHQQHQQQLLDIHSADANNGGHNGHIFHKSYDDHQIEEHDFFGHEESCTDLFSDDQPPSLPWYCSEDWN